MEYKVYETRSKSDYLRKLKELQSKGYKFGKVTGDDWNCRFRIEYTED